MSKHDDNCGCEKKHDDKDCCKKEKQFHDHEFEATSGLQKPVGDGRHVHFVEAKTNVVDDHFHELIFATLIEAPIFEEEA